MKLCEEDGFDSLCTFDPCEGRNLDSFEEKLPQVSIYADNGTFVAQYVPKSCVPGVL